VWSDRSRNGVDRGPHPYCVHYTIGFQPVELLGTVTVTVCNPRGAGIDGEGPR
jgi:hypothetical protein